MNSIKIESTSAFMKSLEKPTNDLIPDLDAAAMLMIGFNPVDRSFQDDNIGSLTDTTVTSPLPTYSPFKSTAFNFPWLDPLLWDMTSDVGSECEVQREDIVLSGYVHIEEDNESVNSKISCEDELEREFFYKEEVFSILYGAFIVDPPAPRAPRRRSPIVEVTINADNYGLVKEKVLAGFVHIEEDNESVRSDITDMTDDDDDYSDYADFYGYDKPDMTTFDEISTGAFALLMLTEDLFDDI